MTNSNLFINGYYRFNHQGLDITYTYKGQTTHLQLCPKATCQLLQDAGLIEGFNLDENSEPVILFTDNTYPAGYGFDRWNSFVCTFKISHRMAQKIMEFREDRKAHEGFQATVAYLLEPLQAA